MGLNSRVFAENRQKNIVEYVNQRQSVTVSELVEYCGVSPATIRNDLHDLAKAGSLKRTHGGAVSLQSVMSATESSINGIAEATNKSKAQLSINEKRSIAQRALDYIQDNDSIMLDAGTTTLELARLLGRYQHLNVITYDLDIAHYLTHNTNVNVFFAGGHVRADLFYCDSYETSDFLQRFKVTLSFLSANGVSLVGGLTSASPETQGIKRILIENSQQAILLADSSKLGKTAFYRFGDLEQVNILITDENADPVFIQEAMSRGISVNKG